MNIKKIKQLKHGQVIRLHSLSYCIRYKYIEKIQYGSDEIYYRFTTKHDPGVDPDMIKLLGGTTTFDKFSKDNNLLVILDDNSWWWPIEVIVDNDFKKIKIL